MTLMREETLSCGACAGTFLARELGNALAAGQMLNARALRHVDVLGRGSSGHAGTVLRYGLAVQGGLSVSAVMPSVAANQQAPAYLRHAAVVAISQSGQSPDLIRYAACARGAGAYVIGLINVDGSPLGDTCDQQIALCAGSEKAVAATKSVVMSMLAGLALVAGFRCDRVLTDALCGLPQRLDAAATCDWSALTAALRDARAVYVVGRGADLGIAKELALKVAEAVGIPALAFSSAEFLHGPIAAVSEQTPVLGLVSDSHALESVLSALKHARGQGARTLLAHGFVATGLPSAQLLLPPALGTLADVVLALVPGYLAIEAAATAAGRDPDRPRGLSKVTETL